jgi:hypothetical protein
VQLQDANLFLDLLKDYRIDAALLSSSTPAVSLPDRLDGWQRVYSRPPWVHVRAAN